MTSGGKQVNQSFLKLAESFGEEIALKCPSGKVWVQQTIDNDINKLLFVSSVLYIDIHWHSCQLYRFRR